MNSDPNITNRKSWKLGMLLALFGLTLSLYSSYEFVHVLVFPYLGEAACNINSALNCEEAIRSPYSAFFGRSLGSWGGVFYSALLIFFLGFTPSRSSSPTRSLALLLVINLISVIFSLILFRISLTSFQALCPVCLLLYCVSLALLGLSYWYDRTTSILSRILSGISSLFILPLLAVRFLLKEIPHQVKGLRAIPFLIALASLIFSTMSDAAMLAFLKSAQQGDHPEKLAAHYWLQEPEQDIPFHELDSGLTDYRKGNSKAAVRIVEFFDFECAACRHFFYELREVVDQFGDQVAIEYRNFPLDHRCNPLIQQSFHNYACHAAEYARCAGEQGLYFETADYLLTASELEEAKTQAMVDLAFAHATKELGLDEEALTECLSSNRQIPVIQRDISLAEKLGLKGTPSVWVNGRLLKNRSDLPLLINYLLSSNPS